MSALAMMEPDEKERLRRLRAKNLAVAAVIVFVSALIYVTFMVRVIGGV